MKKVMSVLFAVVTICVPSASVAVEEVDSQEGRRRGSRVIREFNYEGVQLLPGRQQAQFQHVRDYYMRLRPNDVPRYDQREVPFRWSRAGLAAGKHTITVTVTGRKNEASSGATINVSRLSVYP